MKKKKLKSKVLSPKNGPGGSRKGNLANRQSMVLSPVMNLVALGRRPSEPPTTSVFHHHKAPHGSVLLSSKAYLAFQQAFEILLLTHPILAISP
jgi:hypothetical protein